MNKSILVKLFFAVSATATVSAFANKIEGCETNNSAYFKNSSGMIVRSRYNLCWRTGYWTKANSTPKHSVQVAYKSSTSVLSPVTMPIVPLHESIITTDTFFAFDKAVLNSVEKSKLDKLLSRIGKANLGSIISTGHTDSVGSIIYNKKLSEYRAEAVKTYLLCKGIKSRYIYTNGKGEFQPAVSNQTAVGRAKNRRVEVKVISKSQILPN